MIAVDFGRYMAKIHRDHEAARFGRAEIRNTVRLCWP
jgi:hypothetical protein